MARRRVIGLLLTALFPALALVLGVRMLPFLMMPVLILGPGLLGAGSGPSAPSDGPGDDSGGGPPGGSGGGPPPGPRPPDIDPAAIRVRDLRRPRTPA